MLRILVDHEGQQLAVDVKGHDPAGRLVFVFLSCHIAVRHSQLRDIGLMPSIYTTITSTTILSAKPTMNTTFKLPAGSGSKNAVWTRHASLLF